MTTDVYRVVPESKAELSKYATSYTGNEYDKKLAKKLLNKNIQKMFELQSKLYAFDKYSLLIIFQAMDAAGKDSAIKHVMTGLNPQGTQVFSFKEPSAVELDHDYLWRIHKCTPERGRIGIFNRSHYEEVLIVRVHNLISKQKIPVDLIDKNIWQNRFRQINDFEKHLFENGTIILKFFLHLSKEEQKKRFLRRIDNTSKNWKFSETDISEREYWAEYQTAYEEMISNTGTSYAPWFIIPADNKWFTRLIISEIIIETLGSLNIDYPKLSDDQLKRLEYCRNLLLNEKS
jgi:PPK2 family polyphosphate:nucleotide phosphotransferase